ncbi:hypothetical protein GCM10007079_20910 [Nocardiopsis terrae]|nr:hypothetical protein GCM10007079_20910 [Nocardiopsis terrae]
MWSRNYICHEPGHRRLPDEKAGPLRSRAVACLMLLFAQPASRIVLLAKDDIIQDTDGQVLIRLGDPPPPVSGPFADLLLQAGDQRTNMNTNNRDATWLFPGHGAGRPRGADPRHRHPWNSGAHLRVAPTRAPGPSSG